MSMIPKRETRLPSWRAIVSLAALSASALLVACGGGTSQVQVFQPARVLVLGDESSVIVDDGSADGFKYAINDRTSATAGKCQALPLYWQSVITLYGFVVKECNPTAAVAKAFVLAQPDARVESPVNGMARQIAQVTGGLGKTDLVTVMIGVNDIIALYEDARDGRRTQAAALAEAQRLGGVLATAINGLLGSGARALVLTVPDMGVSPYAINQEKTRPGARALLTRMSYDFNAILRTSIDQTSYDGRNYGLVLADDVVSAMARAPTAFLTSPHNATDAACTTASVKDCTTTTLVTGASFNSHLWASDRHLGPEAHRQIGLLAQSRAVNNPF